jgi:anthranilate phosphoribosyltransferase
MDSAAYSFTPHLETLLAKNDLSENTCVELMNALMDGLVFPASVAAWMVALRAKGESAEELAALASVMRKRAVAVKAPPGTLDTCGTGGDGSATFNISTAAALTAAGMGIPVAKHGGRSVSSKTGSADVLKALGVNIDAKPDVIERCIATAGIGFMFAPNHHPGMKYVAPIRRELGVRTVFNLLGPLSNPAHAPYQLLGVYEPALCEKFARVLQKLGSQSALVVCGAGSGSGYLDEVSTFGPTTIAVLKNGSISVEHIDARQFGIERPSADALAVRNAEDSAAIIRDLLNGKKGPHRDIVVLNAAAAGLAANKASEWPEALKLAERAIDEGRAAAALAKLVETAKA